MPAGYSLAPRRRSGERVRERGLQKSATNRSNEPLSTALSPLVPRRERERQPSAVVGVSRCTQAPGAFRREQLVPSKHSAAVKTRGRGGARPVGRTRGRGCEWEVDIRAQKKEGGDFAPPSSAQFPTTSLDIS